MKILQEAYVKEKTEDIEEFTEFRVKEKEKPRQEEYLSNAEIQGKQGSLGTAVDHFAGNDNGLHKKL